jgi:hypothetical protein
MIKPDMKIMWLGSPHFYMFQFCISIIDMQIFKVEMALMPTVFTVLLHGVNQWS